MSARLGHRARPALTMSGGPRRVGPSVTVLRFGSAKVSGAAGGCFRLRGGAGSRPCWCRELVPRQECRPFPGAGVLERRAHHPDLEPGHQTAGTHVEPGDRPWGRVGEGLRAMLRRGQVRCAVLRRTQHANRIHPWRLRVSERTACRSAEPRRVRARERPGGRHHTDNEDLRLRPEGTPPSRFGRGRSSAAPSSSGAALPATQPLEGSRASSALTEGPTATAADEAAVTRTSARRCEPGRRAVAGGDFRARQGLERVCGRGADAAGT